MEKGWISLHRKLQTNWLWEEKRTFSRAEAWIDILFTVNHKAKKVLIKNTVFKVNRGDSILSLDSWGKRWGWHKSKVRRFFEILQKEGMVITKSEQKTTRLTVCNYDSYQGERNDSETHLKSKRNDSKTSSTPNNNVNNENKENNEEENTSTSSGVYVNIEILKDTYLKNEKLVKAVCGSQKINENQLKKLLDEFNIQLSSTAQNMKTWDDYTSHFLNWKKKKPKTTPISEMNQTVMEKMKQYD